MIQDALAQLQAFAHSDTFFYYHGWGLTINWFILSFISIAIKKTLKGSAGLYLHALLFFVIDVSTLVLTGSALYRIWPHIDQFSTWSPIGQGHVVTGTLFSVFLIFQHIGGVAAMLGADGSGHKKFGYVVSNVFKIVACFGWLLAKQNQYAAYCLALLIVEQLILMALGGKPAEPNQSQKPKTKPKKDERQRSPKRD